MSADLLKEVEMFQQNKYVEGTALAKPTLYTPLSQSPTSITQQTR